LASGLTIIATCAMLEITRQTYDNWMVKGRNGEPPYDEFFAAVRLGLAQHQAKHAVNVEKHALGVAAKVDEETGEEVEPAIKPNADLSRWVLERRHRADFAAQPTTVVNASAQAGAIATAEGARAASDGDLSERLNELRAKHGGDDV